MMKKTYIIEYSAYTNSGGMLKSGKMKAKNKVSSFEAKCSFERFLEKKYSNFGKLVIHNCIEENYMDFFFGDIFGGT